MVLSILLLLAGVVVGLAGFKFFHLLLPVIGLVSGTMAGFIGFQGVFGTGVVSTTVAIFVALAVGIVMALLSFFFFEVAVFVYTAILGASVMAYLGVALGLGENGFIMFLLGLFGFVVGAVIASHAEFSTNLILAVTSFVGVAFILASVFLLVGNVSVAQLHETGIVKTVLEVVDQSFLWLFVWISGSVVAMAIQRSMLKLDVLGNRYQFEPVKK